MHNDPVLSTVMDFTAQSDKRGVLGGFYVSMKEEAGRGGCKNQEFLVRVEVERDRSCGGLGPSWASIVVSVVVGRRWSGR